jgi:hypothetical protein
MTAKTLSCLLQVMQKIKPLFAQPDKNISMFVSK